MIALIALPFLLATTVTAPAQHAAPERPAVMTGVGPATAAQSPSLTGQRKLYGYVQSLSGTTLLVRNRNGRDVAVDVRVARTSVFLFRGRPVIIFGSIDSAGIVHAKAIWRTFPDAAHWPADR